MWLLKRSLVRLVDLGPSYGSMPLDFVSADAYSVPSYYVKHHRNLETGIPSYVFHPLLRLSMFDPDSDSGRRADSESTLPGADWSSQLSSVDGHAAPVASRCEQLIGVQPGRLAVGTTEECVAPGFLTGAHVL